MFKDITITLLTSEEYSKFESIIPRVTFDWWWLKDAYPADNHAVRCVDEDGALLYIDCNIVNGVRPALRMPLSNHLSLKPGDKLRIGSKSFTILSWEKDNVFALCDEIIIVLRFDPIDNEWDCSEIKEWLETDGLRLIF